MLLTREQFKKEVFSRDNNKCVICGKKAVDAHHIIDRKLFTFDDEKDGYFLDNGASLCEEHHILAEKTLISCEELRIKAGVKKVIYPKHLHLTEFVHDYDKWGNPIIKGGMRLKGDSFYDENVQKILKEIISLHVFEDDYHISTIKKYPRTYHFDFSPGTTNDDRISKSIYSILRGETVYSEKLDGENCLDENSVLNTEDGEKTIREICETKYSGKVLCYNHDLNIEEYMNIVNHIISENTSDDEWFEIEIENGEKLKLTGEHRVWLENLNCYRRVFELKEGDEIKLKN